MFKYFQNHIILFTLISERFPMLSVVKQLLAVLTILILSGSAVALTVSGAEADLSFNQKPYTYEFQVINESSQSYPFDVILLAPVGVNRISQPSVLGPNSTNDVVLQLIPNDELLNQTIAGTLIVKYGSNETKKEVTLTFQKATDSQPENPGFPNPIGGLFALAFSATIWELVVDAILLAVVVVLIVGLIARVSKRVKKQ